MFELEDFGDFLTCRGVIDEEVTRPLSEEFGILTGFCACQDPLPASDSRSVSKERYDTDDNSLVQPPQATDGRVLVLTQSVARDDSCHSGESNEAEEDHPTPSNSKVMIVVVRRDKTNNSLGLGMIP